MMNLLFVTSKEAIQAMESYPAFEVLRAQVVERANRRWQETPPVLKDYVMDKFQKITKGLGKLMFEALKSSLHGRYASPLLNPAVVQRRRTTVLPIEQPIIDFGQEADTELLFQGYQALLVSLQALKSHRRSSRWLPEEIPAPAVEAAAASSSSEALAMPSPAPSKQRKKARHTMPTSLRDTDSPAVLSAHYGKKRTSGGPATKRVRTSSVEKEAAAIASEDEPEEPLELDEETEGEGSLVEQERVTRQQKAVVNKFLKGVDILDLTGESKEEEEMQEEKKEEVEEEEAEKKKFRKVIERPFLFYLQEDRELYDVQRAKIKRVMLQLQLTLEMMENWKQKQEEEKKKQEEEKKQG